MALKQNNILHDISSFLGLPPSMLSSDTRFKEDLGLTEWELVWLINQMERRYHIEINDAALLVLTTPRVLESVFAEKTNEC